MGKFRFDRWY